MRGKVGGYWSNSSQGGLFSLHSLNETYQESYQSYEVIRYDTIPAGWPSSRRCGCASARKLNRSQDGGDGYFYDTEHYYSARASSNGNASGWHDEGRKNYTTPACPAGMPLSYANTSWTERYGDFFYGSLCTTWMEPKINTSTTSCPKGWGYSWEKSTSGYYVQNAQGCEPPRQEPVYGYVTRYRTAYYNYITARVSKA